MRTVGEALAATALVIASAVLTWAGAAGAAPPKDPPSKCAPDAVLAGSVCVDKYEASVWRIPDPFGINEKLVKDVRKGKAEYADLIAGGATQLGTASDDYAPCDDQGQNCADDIYAVSLPAVTPARYATWFQVQEACTNSGKRLPSNAEWQGATNGTPDPGGDNGTTDCNTTTAAAVVATGSRSACVSLRGAYDMVGNVYEWMADWVTKSDSSCPGWGAFSNDHQCFAGADTVSTGGPGVLVRGGGENAGVTAGSLAVVGYAQPNFAYPNIGFRCAR
jgi:formylglycine-generating enzyme required for sulfatase activity